jgi:hypothetical protein
MAVLKQKYENDTKIVAMNKRYLVLRHDMQARLKDKKEGTGIETEFGVYSCSVIIIHYYSF